MTLEQQRRINQEQQAQQRAQQQNTQRMIQQQNANRQAAVQQAPQAMITQNQNTTNQLQDLQRQLEKSQANQLNMQQSHAQQLQDLQRQLEQRYATQRNLEQGQTQKQIQDLQKQLEESNTNQKNLQQQLQDAQAKNQAAMNAQETLQSTKPISFSRKWGDQIDELLNNINQPREFKWNFNDDELFKLYADEYTQNGRQASMDAMGQAAALTGGYGNSYAQQVGNQAYDEYLRALYDKGMDLRDRAYEQWQNEGQDMHDRLGALQNAEQQEYDRYRDEVGDWKDERNFNYEKDINQRDYDRGVLESDRAYDRNVLESDRNYDRNVLESDRAYDRGVLESDRAFDEQVRQADLDEAYRRDTFNWQKDTDQRDFDYNKEIDERNFNEEQRQFDAQMEENVRQFNESLDWDKMSEEQKYAAEYALAILQNGQMPSAEMLEAAGLSAEDAEKLMAQIEASGGGTGSGKNKTVYVDKNGLFYTYDSKGNARSISEEEVAKGGYDIDKSEDTGTKGAQAAINDKYRKENDDLKKHYKNSK